jgi:hypothetical protein
MKPFFGTTCIGAASQVIDVIKATEQYRTVASATSGGFEPVTQHIPGRGAFYIRPDRLDSIHNLVEPEGLFYGPGPGGLTLMGVYYLHPVWLDQNPPAGFIGSGDVWSLHDDFCIAQGLAASEGTPESACGAAGGVWWNEMGHFLPAWLFRYNPTGVFAETNPDVP